MHNSRAYLSLLIRPDDVTDQLIIDTLDQALPSKEKASIRLQCKVMPPCILFLLPIQEALVAAQALQSIGCSAFAPTPDDLLALGPTMKVKDISLTFDGVAFDLWRDPRHVIDPDDIDVIIRAKMSEDVKQQTSVEGSFLHGRDDVRSPAMALAWGVGGAYGLAVGMYSPAFSTTPPPPTITPRIEAKLDIHTKSGTVYQVDGNKFGFEILGADRGYADAVNIDRLCEYIIKLTTNAVLDPYFKFFKPPVDHTNLKIPNRAVNQDNPAFAFYSRWITLGYRYLAAGG